MHQSNRKRIQGATSQSEGESAVVDSAVEREE
jgi:hypothetical protein